jgi:UDP-2,3-diacylglucosamine pyrophosphatase LpxH
MKIRNYILTLLLLSLCIINGLAQENNDLIITHGPYIQNVTKTGATIVFSTNKLVVPGVLINSNNDSFELVQNSHDGLIDVGDNLHKVRIENLKPGNNYEYRLFAREILNYRAYNCTFGDTLISKTFNFRTIEPNKESVNFTVFCDVHDRAGKLSAYLDHNDITKQDCYFLNGDIMGHIEEESQLYSSFLDTCVSRFASEKPFYYIRGNHETRGSFARNLKNYLDLPDDKYYYAFTMGPVRFIAIDSGEDKPDNSKEYSGLVDFDRFRFEELEWLKKEVESDDFKKARYKIVLVHMPIIKSKKNWYGMAFLAEHFGPVLKDANIDLMISGHTHRNRWIKAEKSGFNYPVLISSNNNFIEAEVNNESISIILKDIDGNIEKRYTIAKD